MRKIYFILLLNIITFCLISCGISMDNSPLSASPVDISIEEELATPQVTIFTKTDNGETYPSLSVSGTTDVPEDGKLYDYNPEHLNAWWYFVDEAYRGVDQFRITDWLNYHSYTEFKDGNGSFSFSITYPILDGSTVLVHEVNNYFKDLYNLMLNSEQYFQKEYNSMSYLTYEYEQTVRKCYQWGVFFTTVGEFHSILGKTHIEPFGFNFNVRTGQYLNLSDLFIVEASEYEKRLRESIRSMDTGSSIFELDLYPGYKDGRFKMPLPKNNELSQVKSKDEYFLITPIGLVFLYESYVINSGCGAELSSQFVPYEEIMDILNPDLFDECLDVSKSLYSNHSY